MTYLQAISDAHARGDARRRARARDGRGHRRLRRRLQGHRRLHRGVRPRPRDGHAAGRVGRSSAPRSAPPSSGMRPICEMQFADFISCGFDQLVNVAGKMYYRQGLPVNITVRLPSRRRLLRRAVPLPEPRGVVHARARDEGRRAVDGRGRQGPAASPPSATPTRSVYMEHKHLYRRVKGEVPDGRLRDAVHRARRPRGLRPDGRSPTARWCTRRSRRPRTSTAPRSRCSTCARWCRSTRRRSSTRSRKTARRS